MDQKFEFFSDDYVFDSAESLDDSRELIVRLDKWLWAARFFKTRAVARLAVEKGKVLYNGDRVKASREIELGATICIQQGRMQKTIIVRGLSTRRRGTEESIQLFEETEESRLNREETSAFVFQSDYDQPQSQFQPRPFYLSVPKQKNHNNYNNYNSVAASQQPRDRHPIRFLRRSFNKSTNSSKADAENFD